MKRVDHRLGIKARKLASANLAYKANRLQNMLGLFSRLELALWVEKCLLSRREKEKDAWETPPPPYSLCTAGQSNVYHLLLQLR